MKMRKREDRPVRGPAAGRLLRRFLGERGAAAVEFAIVAPLLFLLVFAIIDFGFAFHGWDAVQNAAREGARVGAVTPSVAQIQARVRSASSFLDQSKVTVTVECARGGSSSFGTCGSGASWSEGDLIRVTVNYDYSYMTPLPSFVGMGQTLHETAVTEARFEGL
jgi:Flp pilus assembly protein TadG